MNIVIGRIHDHGRLSDANPSLTSSCSIGMTQSLPSGRIAPVITSMASSARLELGRGRAGALDSLDAETALAAPQRVAVHRHAIHGDAIEGRMVALRINIFPQRSADTLRQRQ